MSFLRGRRSFVSGLAAFAGLTIARSPVEAAAAQAAARPQGDWDLAWLDQFKGRHKQVYDLGGMDLSVEPRPMRFTRNFLDTFRDVYRLEGPDINTAVGISRDAFPINASDAIWQKYRLGELWKIQDPATKQPAVRNIFLGPATNDTSVKAVQARGTVFWQCNVALGAVVQTLADATKMPAADVRADLIAGLNPGVRLVPSHVMALGLVQERGFTYMRP